MGEVFRARDTRLNRFVALKLLPHQLTDDADRLRRFQREAEILASLNHPNNVPYTPLVGNAVGPGGAILLPVQSADIWFYRTVALDPRTGTVRRIPVTYEGDVFAAGWTADGRVISAGIPLRSSLWRFRREDQSPAANR